MTSEQDQGRIEFLLHNQGVFEYGEKAIGKTRFGVLTLRSGKMLGNYEDHILGLNVKAGERFLEVHLDVPKGQTYSIHQLVEAVGASFGQIADFLEHEEPSLLNRPILGFTTSKISSIVRRYNFPTTTNVPSDRVELTRYFFEITPQTAGRDLGPIVLWALPASQLVRLPKLARFRK